jgi:hypothetical protein
MVIQVLSYDNPSLYSGGYQSARFQSYYRFLASVAIKKTKYSKTIQKRLTILHYALTNYGITLFGNSF